MDSQETARERFVSSVREAGGSLKASSRLGCTRSYVDRTRTGQRRPGMNTAAAIEREFGIRMQDWVAPDAKAGKKPGGSNGAGV